LIGERDSENSADTAVKLMKRFLIALAFVLLGLLTILPGPYAHQVLESLLREMHRLV
jgi:hypothetical protein